eukprot:1160590-Pelagomonas_calceolata.AAC.13
MSGGTDTFLWTQAPYDIGSGLLGALLKISVRFHKLPGGYRTQCTSSPQRVSEGAAAERNWSAWRRTYTALHNQLSRETAEMLVYTKANMPAS